MLSQSVVLLQCVVAVRLRISMIDVMSICVAVCCSVVLQCVIAECCCSVLLHLDYASRRWISNRSVLQCIAV